MMRVPTRVLGEPHLGETNGSNIFNVSINSVLPDFENSSINKDTWDPQSTRGNDLFHDLVLTLTFSLIPISFLGNGLVCYVVYANPRMRTVTNFFILNLAISEMLMNFLYTSDITGRNLLDWPFTSELCHVHDFAEAASTMAVSNSLVAISVDRYVAITRPFKPLRKKKDAKIAFLAIWIPALIVFFPELGIRRFRSRSQNFEECVPLRDLFDFKEFHYSLVILLQFLIPSAILIFAYSSIMIKICNRKPPGEVENDSDRLRARSMKKVVKMTGIVVCIFPICWLPFQILSVVWMISPRMRSWSGHTNVYYAANLLTIVHSCCNPFIYFWMSSKYRDAFVAIFQKIPVVRRCIPQQNKRKNIVAVSVIQNRTRS